MTAPFKAGPLLGRARAARADGDADGCIALCHQILRAEPGHRGARLLLAQVLAVRADRAAALGVIEAGLALAPGDRDMTLRRLALLRAEGRLAEARDVLRAARAGLPGDAALLIESAQLARLSGNLPGARLACERALRLSPALPAARMLLAEVMALSGDHAGLAALAVSAQEAGEMALWARAVLGLPPEDAAPLLAGMGQGADLAALSGAAQWALCLLAERLGQPALARALAAALLARPLIEPVEARAVMALMHGADLPHWAEAADALLPKLPVEARADFRCEWLALARGPEAALAARPRDPRGTAPLRLREARLFRVTRLLRQCGRVRLAARWQRLALRGQSLQPALFRLHFVTLLQAGMPAAARALLSRVPSGGGLRWREAVAQSWAELDQPERACALAVAGGGAMGWTNMLYPRCLMRLGRDAEARAVLDRMRALRPGAQAAHYQGSVDALLHLEAGLAQEDADEVEAQGRLVTPAIRRIAAAPASAPARAAPDLPRRIVQYWDATTLPNDIARVAQSWDGLPGWTLSRFDRRAARDYLRGALDGFCLPAFDLARSATEESDFFRLCVIAIEGGVYVDCDDWRTGDPAAFLARSRGLLLLREPSGSLANNFIAAPARHPALIRAMVMARRALLERHNDSTWSKTGPGLMTRAVAWYLDDCASRATAPALTLRPMFEAGLLFDAHVPLSYKQTARYWRSGPDRADLAGWIAEGLAPQADRSGAMLSACG